MKLDKNLLRQILLKTEKLSPGECFDFEIGDYTTKEIIYHVQLLEEAYCIKTQDLSVIGDRKLVPKSLTKRGHTFTNAARDSSRWEKAVPILLNNANGAVFNLLGTYEISNSDHSIHIGGDVTGSALVSGDRNTVSVQFQQASLPQPETVDIQAELKALQTLLASFNDPIATGVAQKLEQEASKPKPDKSVVATTLETGLTYAQKLSGFAEAIDKLRPHVEATAGWLGEHGYKLLSLVRLAL